MKAGSILELTDRSMIEAFGHYAIIVSYRNKERPRNKYAAIFEGGIYIGLLYDAPGKVVGYNSEFDKLPSEFEGLRLKVSEKGCRAFHNTDVSATA
ncbi:MAG: hypothetical protein ACJAS1_003684 [Oleiphilaceae bacterium]|jgi:hypothetical protein